MNMLSWGPADLTYEEAYNTYAKRLFPMDGVPEPAWGGAWVAVEPGETTTRHSHDEKEMFFVVSGEGILRLGDEERRIGFGDTIFMTPDVEHDLTNVGPDRLLFLSIWWDGSDAPAPEPAS